jgi:hypothetical protein
LDLSNSIQSGDFAPGAISISSSDISDGSVTYNKLSLADNEIPYTKLDLSNQITGMDIANNANIVYSKLDLYESITDTDISNSAAISYSKLDLSNSIQETDLAPGVLATTITTGDIENGSVTYEKLDLADGEIPYSKINLYNAIDSSAIKNSRLYLYDLTASGTLSAYSLNVTDTTTIAGKTTINDNLTVTGTINANALELTDTATIYGQTHIYNNLNVSGNATAITMSTNNLAMSQYISYTAAGYESRLIFAAPSTNQSITIPDMSGKLVAVSTDGLNGQSLVADGSGGYSWQTISGSSGSITVTDIEDGAVTYAKMDLADYIIPYTKVDLYNAIESNDIKDSSLNLNYLTTTGTLNANTMYVTDTTFYGQTTVYSDLNVSGNAIISGTLSTDILAINQHLSYSEAGYESKLVFASPSTSQSITIPDMSGKLVAVSTDGLNGQSLVADGSGGYSWQTITASGGDVFYSSVTVTNGISFSEGSLDSMAAQSADSVDINGGEIDGTAIGEYSASTGKFTTLTSIGPTTIESSIITLGVGTTASPGKIVLHDNQSGDSFTTTIQAADNVDANFTLTLPSSAGSADQLLTTDGAGNLTWVTSNINSLTITTAGEAILDDADAANQRTTLGLGSIATQDSNSVDIDGGAIDGTTIGATTASTGIFTNVTVVNEATINGHTNIYNDLNVSGNVDSLTMSTNTLSLSQYISYTEAGYESRLVFASPSTSQSITIPDMSGKLVAVSTDGLNGQSLVADGAGGYSWQTIAGSGGAITVTDIEDGAVTYAKLNLADYIIPYTKVDLNNAIDSNDINDSTLNLNNLTTTGTLQANALLVTDTTIIEGNTTINNHLSVTGTSYANALSITDTATINGATTINDNLAVTGTTIIDGQTDIFNDLNVSGNAFINGTVTSSALALSQYILFTDGLHENKLVLESLSGWNSLTIPDMTGKLVAVQSDGTNGQALVADGLGSYTWQTLETSSDVNYTSVTASKADFDNLTVNNAFVLYNSENPAGQILMSTSAALPQLITIPDISGTVVVTEKQGANGQAVVSDGSGGYTWQTLNNGLTHEITVGDGGDYTTITEAIDSITDNNILNHYVIKVSPGIFEEQIKMKEYVEIKGSGKNATIIKSVGSDSGVYTAATVIGGNDTAISNLSIHCMTSANYAVGIYNSGDSLLIDNLIIIVMTSSVSAETYGIYQYSGSTAISNVGITSSVAGISGNCFGIYFENVSDKTVLKHSVIEAAGGAWACGIHNINASPSIQHTNISVRLANGYNYGIWNDSYATPTINHVDIKVSGIFGSYENLAINNSYSSPIVKNTAGDVLVSSSGSNYGIMNNNESKPELHNVTLNVKNGSTNLQIYNMDALSKIILNATTYTGNLNADSAELTQITIKSNAYLLTSMTFQGYSSTDGKETIIKITEPTQSNTIRFPDASGTVMLSGGSGGTLDVSSVTANAGTYTEMTVSNQISVSKTTISGDIMLADEYSPISGNTTPADTALYYGDKDTDGAWRMVRIGESLVMQRRESGVWVSKMSVNP